MATEAEIEKVCRAMGWTRERYDAGVRAVQLLSKAASLPRGGTCVLCGDPTDRPGYRYCSECYR